MSHRSTAFVTFPIVALAVASLAVVMASLLIGAREADNIALLRQRETIQHAIRQHGHSLARELRPQTIWTDAFERTKARDTAWMQNFYGSYLGRLLGYDRLYVLDEKDAPIFGYDPETQGSLNFADLGGQLDDLVRAARAPQQMAEYNPIVTRITLGNGKSAEHVAVADTRNIDGRPSTVVVSTVMPDKGRVVEMQDGEPPVLLVAVENLDKIFTAELGKAFGYESMRWEGASAGVMPAATLGAENTTSQDIFTREGATVGKLLWLNKRPSAEFIRRVIPGLLLALVMISLLTYLLISWGRRHAHTLLQSEEHAKLAARTDGLTQLPNRMALRERLPRMLRYTQNDRNTLAVLEIDINQFKAINDAFGSAIGDAVLIATSRRLAKLLPDKSLIARLDGATFVIIAPGLGPDQAHELANDAIAAIAEPYILEGSTRVFATASAGYAIGPTDGRGGDELLRRANLALDKSKQAGVERALAFTPEMDAEATYRHMLEMALRDAVADGTISVLYQPLMDTSGHHVLGVEALARWSDPTLGPVSPEIFIPLAEETGVIQEIGKHVLRSALQDGKMWPHINVAVNVSASQIHHGDVVEVVRDVLNETQFPAQRLEIELTESVLLADEKRANEQMRGLQNLGVKVALDDFGTGYSSLSYLRRFGFDKLKIDRSFIESAGAPQDSTVILASIIKLGQDLDLTITAEGVETEQQRRWLQHSGCHQLQGYLFSRPITADEMTAFLADHAQKNAVAS